MQYRNSQFQCNSQLVTRSLEILERAVSLLITRKLREEEQISISLTKSQSPPKSIIWANTFSTVKAEYRTISQNNSDPPSYTHPLSPTPHPYPHTPRNCKLEQDSAVNTQAVIRADLVFFDTSTWFPGNLQDYQVLRNSSFYERAGSNEILLHSTELVSNVAVTLRAEILAGRSFRGTNFRGRLAGDL